MHFSDRLRHRFRALILQMHSDVTLGKQMKQHCLKSQDKKVLVHLYESIKKI